MLVSEDANFTMNHIDLTVVGFTQISVAWKLIEISSNIEKGLFQRFFWLVPKPVMVSSDELQQVDRDFSAAVSKIIIFSVYVTTIRECVYTRSAY